MKRMVLIVAVLSLIGCTAEESAEAVPAEQEDVEVDEQQNGEVDDASDGQDSESDENEENANDNTGGGTGQIHPRWVLYDGDDEPVEMIVSPVVPDGPQQAGEQWNPENISSPDCIRIDATDSYRPGMYYYELESGEMLPCISTGDQNFRYTDAQCDGQKYVLQPHRLSILNIGGQPYWPEGEAIEAPEDLYHESDGECRETASDGLLLPVEPVPGEVKNLLSNPPYELKAKY